MQKHFSGHDIYFLSRGWVVQIIRQAMYRSTALRAISCLSPVGYPEHHISVSLYATQLIVFNLITLHTVRGVLIHRHNVPVTPHHLLHTWFPWNP